MQLSNRLTAVANLVSDGKNVADIGTDHAYIPIYLTEKKLVKKALAMDVNQGPLERADENIRQHGLTDQIETRLSDGLDALLPGEVESIIIAGMGGPLEVRILENGKNVVEACEELILQPQSDLRQVRAYLEQIHWSIEEEEMILEDGKYYPMMRAVREKEEYAPMSDIELRFGPVLLRKKHPVLRLFLEKELGVQKKILNALAVQNTETAMLRKKEVEEEIHCLQEALKQIS